MASALRLGSLRAGPGGGRLLHPGAGRRAEWSRPLPTRRRLSRSARWLN